jgi:hypothetical protein
VPARYRLLAATLAARVSSDRRALDLLLTSNDLPSGWYEERELRLRLGFIRSEDRDKRARRAKLIGAVRVFVDAESRSRVTAWAYPQVNDEDARSAAATAFARGFGSFDLMAEARDEAEVTPPPEAGQHARGRLVSTTGRMGDCRNLTVVWADSGSLLMGVSYRAPAHVDLWDLTSALVKRQRERLVYGPDDEAAASLDIADGHIDVAATVSRARPRRWHLRRVTRVAIPLAILAGVAFAYGTSGSANSGFAGAPTVGHFAGYQETDAVVSQISATITVPRISPGSSYSDAGTWVGAQVLGQDYRHLPFVQVGINEDESDYQPPTDAAFWSDNAHHFNPVLLFSVKPGDRVSVSLIHAHRHWIITAVDGTTHRRIVTSQEGGATFGLGEWAQEDTDVGSYYYVYPKMTDVHISKLSINDRPPARSVLYPDWMSIGHRGAAFKPTAPTRDAFAVVPTRAALAAQP